MTTGIRMGHQLGKVKESGPCDAHADRRRQCSSDKRVAKCAPPVPM